MTRLVVRPQADVDIDAAADYLFNVGEMDLALKFLDALDRSFRSLLELPRSGPEVHAIAARLPGSRFWPVPDFQRFLVFYWPFAGFLRLGRP